MEGAYHSSVVHYLELSLEFALLIRPWLLEVGRFAKVVVVQLGFEAVVRGLGEHAFLFED